MTEKNVAQWVCEQLAAWGVQAIYGVVGDAILPLVDAISKHPVLKFYSVKHEVTAAFMASAEAKLMGRMGVCIATSGPGAANLVNGLADAKSDRVPVLAITGQVDSFNLGTNYKQYIDQGQLLAPTVGYSGLVTTPDSCNDILVRAMRTAIYDGTAVHVGFTKDVWKMLTEEAVRQPEPYLKTPAQSAPVIIGQAVQKLNEAERPAILVGGGIRNLGQFLFELAEKWGSGICMTMAAKGMLSGDHPLVLGGLGEGGSEAATKMLAEADMVLIIGATWWPEQYVPQNARVIQMDAVPENIGGRMPVEYGLVGELALLLPLVKDGIIAKDKAGWVERIHSFKSHWLKQIMAEMAADGSPVSPGRLIKSLENVISEDAIIALDVGDHTIWFNRIFGGSRQDVLFSGSWRTMGFGLPAAISAKLAEPERQVVAVIGDGGFAQGMAEFSTAVRYRVPITVIVVNNGYLAMEKGKMEVENMNYQVTSLTNPDFAKYAEVCGGKGFRVEQSADLESTLAEAFGSQISTIVDVITTAPIFPALMKS